MTSTQKIREAKKNTPKRWDAYVAEADIPDFVLEVSDDRSQDIRVKCPTGDQVIDAYNAREDGDVETGLKHLTGDAYEQVRALVGNAPYKAMNALFEDISDHFELRDPTQSN